jgi:V/A-type H+-transporting ATPase subunit D
MAKLKLTKNELKKQKESLKRFVRYLPTLELKKKQLVAEIKKIEEVVIDLEKKISIIETDLEYWIDVFGEDVKLESLIYVKEINTDEGNIAGIDIPLFNSVTFEIKKYDLMTLPLWVDTAIEVLKQLIELKMHIRVAKEQQDILREELRKTMQRINLFDKVMIPQAKENIRVIRIYLGDQQTAEVVRGKIAKTKIARKKEAEVA